MNHVIHIPKAGMMLITNMVFFSRELDGIGSLTWGTVGSVMRYPFHGNGANANYRFQEHVSGSPFSIISSNSSNCNMPKPRNGYTLIQNVLADALQAKSFLCGTCNRALGSKGLGGNVKCKVLQATCSSQGCVAYSQNDLEELILGKEPRKGKKLTVRNTQELAQKLQTAAEEMAKKTGNVCQHPPTTAIAHPGGAHEESEKEESEKEESEVSFEDSREVRGEDSEILSSFTLETSLQESTLHKEVEELRQKVKQLEEALKKKDREDEVKLLKLTTFCHAISLQVKELLEAHTATTFRPPVQTTRQKGKEKEKEKEKEKPVRTNKPYDKNGSSSKNPSSPQSPPAAPSTPKTPASTLTRASTPTASPSSTRASPTTLASPTTTTRASPTTPASPTPSRPSRSSAKIVQSDCKTLEVTGLRLPFELGRSRQCLRDMGVLTSRVRNLSWISQRRDAIAMELSTPAAAVAVGAILRKKGATVTSLLDGRHF